MKGIEVWHLPQNWRINSERLSSQGSHIFKYSSLAIQERDTQGELQAIKVRRIDCPLFGIRLDLRGSGREMVKAFIDGLRNHNLNDPSIERLTFDIALADHELGENFVDEVIKEIEGKEDITIVDRVIAMKNLGFGKDQAGHWIFSANGWRRENPEDAAMVEAVVSEVYGNED